MIPSFCLTRLNHRYNTMTCTKPCKNCKCNDLPLEADVTTPLAKAMHEEITRIIKERR